MSLNNHSTETLTPDIHLLNSSICGHHSIPKRGHKIDSQGIGRIADRHIPCSVGDTAYWPKYVRSCESANILASCFLPSVSESINYMKIDVKIYMILLFHCI